MARTIKLSFILFNVFIVLFLGGFFSFINAKDDTPMEAKMVLTPQEKELAVRIGFDKDILLIVKRETKSELLQFISAYNEVVNGLCILVPRKKEEFGYILHPKAYPKGYKDKTEQIAEKLRFKLKSKGYMVFITKMGFGYEPDRIGILKGFDQYEILRIQKTQGNDFPITHEAIVAKLKEWEKRYPFEIVGADRDWISAQFKVMPEDVHAFAKEAYAICPDIVGGGPNIRSVDDLAKSIEEEKGFYLWWD